MPEKTLTRAEISEAIAENVGFPRHRSMELLEQILEQMIVGLVEDGELKLSSFGSFNVRQKNNRIGRNPKTGKEVMITPRKTISFRASHILKEGVLKK
ncbi:integration host factor subunit alpha [Candidatus Paracaedimonas acanthamoebae]|nr:integration host factor subunit alpha [Candidatus Paracaedimonas acanthamoebae]